MLRPTSKMVAKNRTRSDLSLRAMSSCQATKGPHYTSCTEETADSTLRPSLQLDGKSPETMPGRPIRIEVSGQQSSVGLGWRHQLRGPGQPAFPAADPSPRKAD